MSNKYISEININYYFNKFEKEKNVINIFGDEFVKKNINNCIMIINNKEYKITSKFMLENYNDKLLHITLKGIENITDMSDMFRDCVSLISLYDISKWDTSKITNMRSLFRGCISLFDLRDISKWNTRNVTDMSYMFFNCFSLSSLPDISKWNTNKVTNMSYLFCREISLTSKSIIGSQMFDFSFFSLLDIPKLNTSNIINMSYMFKDCLKLSSLPDISKWNTSSKMGY